MSPDCAPPAVMIGHDKHPLPQRAQLMLLRSPVVKIMRHDSMKVDAATRIRSLDATDSPVIIGRESIPHVVGRSDFAPHHECLMTYQHTPSERLPSQQSRSREMPSAEKSARSIHYISITIYDIGITGSDSISIELQRATVRESVAGIQKEQISPPCQTQPLVHAVIDTRVSFRMHNDIRKFSDNIQSPVGRRTVSDNMLEITKRLFADASHSLFDTIRSIKRHGYD